jgi:hypothetical protein
MLKKIGEMKIASKLLGYSYLSDELPMISPSARL